MLPDFESDGVLKNRKLKGRRMKTCSLHFAMYRGLRCPTVGYITEILLQSIVECLGTGKQEVVNLDPVQQV